MPALPVLEMCGAVAPDVPASTNKLPEIALPGSVAWQGFQVAIANQLLPLFIPQAERERFQA